MPIFEWDWPAVLENLDRWDALPPSARKTLLRRLRPGASLAVTALGGDAQALLDAGFAERLVKLPAIRLRESARRFATAFRSMDRMRIFDVRQPDLDEYIRNILTGDQCCELAGMDSYEHYYARGQLAMLATSANWLEKYLNDEAKPQPAPRVLHLRRRPATAQELPGLRTDVREATRKMLRAMMALTGPCPLREAARLLPGADRELLASVIDEGVGRLLFFPALTGDGMEPVIGIWPAISRRLHRPAPQPPRPIEKAPAGAFSLPFLADDMVALLVACAREPVRLKAYGGEIFTRARDEIAGRLISLPPWVGDILEHGPFPDAESKPDPDPGYWDRPSRNGGDAALSAADRVARAHLHVSMLHLAKRTRNDRGHVSLHLLPAGMEWLSLNSRERLRKLLDLYRLAPDGKPGAASREMDADDDDDRVNGGYDYYEREQAFGPHWPGGPGRAKTDRTRHGRAVTGNFSDLRNGGFVPLQDFLDHRARTANPFLALQREGGSRAAVALPSRFWHRQMSSDDMEALWAETLWSILAHVLTPLGGAAWALAGEKDSVPHFALTGAGLYLLGLADDFEFSEAAAAGGLVVQPNFEIVFLSAAPALEAACARFAERCGRTRSVGTLFRITKKSVFDAASTGGTAEAVIGTLAGACSKPLPANVEREIRGWFGQCRLVGARPALLIECPDAETADRVLACGLPSVRITATVLELHGEANRTQLAKRLRAQGIFLKP